MAKHANNQPPTSEPPAAGVPTREVERPVINDPNAPAAVDKSGDEREIVGKNADGSPVIPGSTAGVNPDTRHNLTQSTPPGRVEIFDPNAAPTGPAPVVETPLPEGEEERQVREARERAGPRGNVFRVTGTMTTGHKGIVASTDFPEGTDFQHLMRAGALEAIGDLKPDPKTAHDLGKHGLDAVEDLHDMIIEMRSEYRSAIDRLTARVEKLEADKK